MTDPFWTPGLSPALAQAEVAEAAARAALGQAAGADGFTEEAGAHVALDRARRVIAASGAPAVTGTDDDLFRGSERTTAYGGSTCTTWSRGPAFPPGAGGGGSTSTTAILSGAGDHLPGCGCGPCASREVAEILAVLSEPLGLPANELEEKLPYGTAPPGTCQTCFRGPVYEAKHLHQLCLYCWTLNQAQRGGQNPDRRCAYDPGLAGLRRRRRTAPTRPAITGAGRSGSPATDPAGDAAHRYRTGGAGCTCTSRASPGAGSASPVTARRSTGRSWS